MTADLDLSGIHDSADTRTSSGYLLSAGVYRTPVVTDGKRRSKSAGRETPTHAACAVHKLADVLQLNPALAAVAAAMRLPTRTKVRVCLCLTSTLARLCFFLLLICAHLRLRVTRCFCRTFFGRLSCYRPTPTLAPHAAFLSKLSASAADRRGLVHAPNK